MSRKSIRLRLFLASLVSIAVALVVAGFGLVKLFESHVERRFQAELSNYIRQIAGNLSFGTNGTVTQSNRLSDPRFEEPLSGLYWQVAEDGKGVLLRSRSLWDTTLALPPDTLTPGEIHSHILPGPMRTTLLVQEELVIYDAASDKRHVRITAAININELRHASHEFTEALIPSLGMLALVLLGASWFQILVGLRPLEAVRRGVNAVRARQQQRLENTFPYEVMPLVAEVNTLLEAQDQAIERARTRAGDLAHGLKTPLTVLVADARKLKEKGETELGQEVDDMVKVMLRHIDRELTRVRVAEEARRVSAKTNAVHVIRGIVGALRKTPHGADLDWRLDLPDRLDAPVQLDDFMEVAGNLLENAAKWARNWVLVQTLKGEGEMKLVITDDGPGVPEGMIATLGQRGTRLDSQAPGTGIGLAIVKEIVEAYGGTLCLRNELNGGLHTEAVFPLSTCRESGVTTCN
jgi:signal transduction histidine kinase